LQVVESIMMEKTMLWFYGGMKATTNKKHIGPS